MSTCSDTQRSRVGADRLGSNFWGKLVLVRVCAQGNGGRLDALDLSLVPSCSSQSRLAAKPEEQVWRRPHRLRIVIG